MAASIITRVFQFACNQIFLNSAKVFGVGAVNLQQQPVRHRNTKHYAAKWKKLRAAKVKKMDLPDMDKYRSRSNMSFEEKRSEMKRDGHLPPRSFQEGPIDISSTAAIFEEFVPPEGDGRISLVSKEGAKQRFTEFEKKGKSYLQLRKIRQFDTDFDTKEFAEEAQNLYLKTYELLEDYTNEENKHQLHNLVTEKAFPEMTQGLKKKTFRWRFVESIEPARVVHVRTTSMLQKENVYAQVTVRIHSKQALAIYDQFGRLMYGSENLVKDVLEYVVFEKHLANEYGIWRIHGKIVPDWMPPRQPMKKTYRQPPMPTIPEEVEEKESAEEGAVVESSSSQIAQPAAA